ncbi:conserved hypothetical protein [Candidatus Desulfarcum epimagneticum]|uniref:ABC transporter substrate-binding protein n=1 Tax=uncultured Desulfobacteraceae bacterium TaxID=218296 RepID=A0A484HKL6_9BACT|nr:conserved hypothetical protein [uncultured Desulfobacteraceae bacterium]
MHNGKPGLSEFVFAEQKKRMFSLIMTAIFLILSPRIAHAHPHVFIDQRVAIVFGDKGLEGFKIRWTFDEMFSVMISDSYDKDKNGVFGESEVETIKKEAFSNLSEYDYFTFIKMDQKPFDVTSVRDFSATLNDKKKMIYEFFVPCRAAAGNNFKKISVATYDPTYYTAIYFTKERPVSLDNSELFEVKTAIKEDQSTSLYNNTANPWALFLDFRKKK